MNNVENKVYLYGFDKDYKIVLYAYIDREYLSVKELIFNANDMIMRCPNIEEIYAVDNCYAVYRMCRDTMKDSSVENRVVFKMFLEKEGIKII